MPRTSPIAIYFNRRMAALLGLGFAAGLPSVYMLLGDTLRAWLGAFGVDVTTIGLFSLVGLPLAFNFVWAPLMDRFVPRLIPGLGRRRSWLLLLQIALVLGIAALAFAGPTEPGQSVMGLAVLGLIVAFFVASQDVVADAYRTDVLPDEQLGAGAAVFVNGYRVGMIVAGAGALLLAGYLSWTGVYLVLAGLMGVGIVATLIAPEPPKQAPPRTLADAVVHPVSDFLHRFGWRLLAVLAFVVLFKLPDSFIRPMIMPLLQKHLAFELGQIALIRMWMGPIAIMLGAFFGGAVVARLGLIASLWLFGILQATTNLGYTFLAWWGHDGSVAAGVIGVDHFCDGMATAGFIAFLMAQCNRRYSATQYALFTSLMYGAGAILGATTGYFVQAFGYMEFFAFSVLTGVPGLAMLTFLGNGVRRDRDGSPSRDIR